MKWRSDEGSWLRRVEFPAIVALVIAVASVMLGQSAERYANADTQIAAQADPAAQTASLGDKSGPAFSAIDYATTGSIKGQSVILSPCTGQQSPR